MSITVHAFDHREWVKRGLASFGHFADRITKCNVGKEDDGSSYGEWFHAPDKPLSNGDRVIYHGSWDCDHSPGAPAHTHAQIFAGSDPDELAEFTVRVREWESQPEFDDQFESDDFS
ncbi:MAG TPA: hypothetical protein VFG68_10915 [Fimbriiglobus sp.]|nr:hypothetical protein [Fimbriiglobus sp.]